MISNLMFVAFGTGIFFGLLVSIVCLMAGVGLAWSVAAGIRQQTISASSLFRASYRHPIRQLE